MEEQLISIEVSKLAASKGIYTGDKSYLVFVDTNYEDVILYEKVDKPSTIKIEYNAIGEASFKMLYLPLFTQTELQKWLRDTYNINVLVHPTNILPTYDGGEIYYTFSIYIDNNTCWLYDIDNTYDVFEDALDDGLIKGLNLIKNK